MPIKILETNLTYDTVQRNYIDLKHNCEYTVKIVC